MAICTGRKTVTFNQVFSLPGLDGTLPAGAYVVETDVELLENAPFPGYRRVSTFIHLQEKPGSLGFGQILTIEPNELDTAIRRDGATVGGRIVNASKQESGAFRRPSYQEVLDDFDVDRGEDEGMAIGPH